jgi:hypothetical protein
MMRLQRIMSYGRWKIQNLDINLREMQDVGDGLTVTTQNLIAPA